MACRQTPSPGFGPTAPFGVGSGVTGTVGAGARVQRPIRDGVPLAPQVLQIPIAQQIRRSQIQSQNLQTQITAAAAAAAAGGAAATSEVLTLTYTLVSTQLKALFTSPVEILAATAAMIIEPIYLYSHHNQPATLFFTRNANLFHGVTAGGGGGPTAISVLGPFELQSNVIQDTWKNTLANTTTFTATPVNKSLYIKAVGDNDLGFDAGNLNTVTLQLTYRLLAGI